GGVFGPSPMNDQFLEAGGRVVFSRELVAGQFGNEELCRRSNLAASADVATVDLSPCVANRHVKVSAIPGDRAREGDDLKGAVQALFIGFIGQTQLCVQQASDAADEEARAFGQRGGEFLD